MAKKSLDKAKPMVAAAPQDPWRSGRSRLSLQQIRRGRDHKWHFSGQQPNETVRAVVRKHWWFLVVPALPLLGAITIMVATISASALLPAFSTFWYIADVLAVLLVIGTGIWFVWKDFILWWLETFIITDKRIISSRGLLQPTRQETPIEKITQIGLDFHSPLGVLLKFGLVHIYLAGGDLKMENVPDPRKVKDIIQGIYDDAKAKKPKEQPLPKPQDPELAALLDTLAKGKEVPKLADADANYPPLRSADRLRGPRRTFGGFLHIPSEVHYVSGEQTVKYVQRSQFVLLRNLLLPILVLLLILPVAIVPPSVGYIPGSIAQYWWFIMGLAALGALLWIILTYFNYIDDIYILTNRRVIDIQRHFTFTFESRIEAEYKNIRDVKVTVSNVIERLLDVGDVEVETPGNSPNIIFRTVDHPFLIQDELIALKDYKDKVDKIKKENDEKKALHEWFSKVVTKLEDTTKSHGAPDLRNKDLFAAMTLAQDYGLDVTVWGEAIATSNLEPGMVMHQNPPPGTMMSGGSKIEVVLSRKPSLIDQL